MNKTKTMKQIKIIFTIAFLCVVSFSNAQEVINEGATYKVKGTTILKDGVDVTETLTAEKRELIINAFNKKVIEKELIEKKEKEERKRIKEIKTAESKQKKAEKKQKKAEKKLKKEIQLKNNLEKSKKKYSKAQEKFEKLKSKGKLSPEDELDWVKKLKKLEKDIQKKQSKL
jgi:hypothetical protein